MAGRCITPEAKARYSDECRRRGPLQGASACVNARIRLCPPPDVQPVVQQGGDGINLLGVYQICQPKPVELAPYPPSRPMPNEAAAQVAYERAAAQTQKQSSEVMRLERRAASLRTIKVGFGFWLGLGLCGVGAALYATRRGA